MMKICSNVTFLSLIILAVFSFLIPNVFAQEQKTFYISVEPVPDFAKDYAGSVMYDTITAWHNANPNVNLYLTDSSQHADFVVQWIKDNTGGTFSGEAFPSSHAMQVTLGDSNCNGQWQPYSTSTLDRIAEHELGHLLGFVHSKDPNNVMYSTASYFQYGSVTVQQSLGSGHVMLVPTCTNKDVTTVSYNVKTTDQTFGVNVFYIPTGNEVTNYLQSSGQKFQYYNAAGCYMKNAVSFSGTCTVEKGSMVLVASPLDLVNAFQTVVVTMVEKSASPQYYIPIIQNPPSAPPPPPLQLPVTGYAKALNSQYLLSSLGSVQVQISGHVNNAQGGKVVMEIQAPDGTYVYPNPSSIDLYPNGDFLTMIILNKNSQVGNYRIFASYQNLSTGIMLDGGDFTLTTQNPSQPSSQSQTSTQTLTSNGISINMNQVVLTPERHLVVMTISGLVSNNNQNGQLVELTIKNQNGVMLEDFMVEPLIDHSFHSKKVITDKYATGVYVITATYDNNYLGTASFQVINQMTIPEFSSIVVSILLSSIVLMMAISFRSKISFSNLCISTKC